MIKVAYQGANCQTQHSNHIDYLTAFVETQGYGNKVMGIVEDSSVLSLWLLTAAIPLKPVYNKRRYTYQAYRLSKYVSSPLL